MTRVSLSIDAWEADQPRRLHLGDHPLWLGWFHTLDPAVVTFGRGGAPRATLRVIPPDTDPTAARELLGEAPSRGWHSQVMAVPRHP